MTTGITSSSASPPPTSSRSPLSPTEPESAQQQQQKYAPLHRTTLELLYFKAISLYRRRNYEKCSEVCSAMLQTGHENNVQMFARNPDEDEDDVDDGDDADDGNGGGGGGGGGGVGGGSAAGGGGSTMVSSSYASHSSYRFGSIPQRGSKLPPPGRQQQRWHGNNTHGHSSSSSSNNNRRNRNRSVMPTWMMEGIWQLKMRALTQRVYIDDLETNDDASAETEELEFERIATAARPGTSIRTAFVPRPSTTSTGTNQQRFLRIKTAESAASGAPGRPQSARPTSGIARPGTTLSRPGSSLGHRPASRCATASRVRATSAAAYTVGDATAPLYQASRLNPTVYAERQVLVKSLFQFLFYHESDVQKAYSLCEAVLKVGRQKRLSITAAGGGAARLPSPSTVDGWWWDQQMGRCLLALRYPRKAEIYLQQSLAAFPHPDTYLLLSRLYQRLERPQQALDLINKAVERHPFDVTFRTEQGRLFEAMSKPDDAVQMYRLINKLNPINIEALACIAVNYFYDNHPEMAVMYYRRILALGVYTPELYCNIGLCCLYGGQIDLVMPCFQRCLLMAKTAEQRADIWYNLSFVAITTGDFNLARRCLQLCLTADANNGAALNNLAVLAAHGGDLIKAKSYLNAAKEVLSASYEIENNWAYMEKHYKL